MISRYFKVPRSRPAFPLQRCLTRPFGTPLHAWLYVWAVHFPRASVSELMPAVQSPWDDNVHHHHSQRCHKWPWSFVVAGFSTNVPGFLALVSSSSTCWWVLALTVVRLQAPSKAFEAGVELKQTSKTTNNKNLMFFFSPSLQQWQITNIHKYLKNISRLKHLINRLLSRHMKVRSWKTMYLAILTPNAQWHIVMPTFQARPRSQIRLSCSSFFLWPEKETCHPRNHR